MSREITEYCMTCLDSTGSYVEPTDYRATRDESLEWVWEWRDEHVMQHEGKTTFLTVERGQQVNLDGPLGEWHKDDLVTLNDLYPSAADKVFQIVGFAAIGDQGFIALFNDKDDPTSAYLDHMKRVERDELVDVTVTIQFIRDGLADASDDGITEYLRSKLNEIPLVNDMWFEGIDIYKPEPAVAK